MTVVPIFNTTYTQTYKIQSVCPSVHPSVSLSQVVFPPSHNLIICNQLQIYLVCLFVCWFGQMLTPIQVIICSHPPVGPSICPSICLSACPSICPSACSSICPSVCLSVCLHQGDFFHVVSKNYHLDVEILLTSPRTKQDQQGELFR